MYGNLLVPMRQQDFQGERQSLGCRSRGGEDEGTLRLLDKFGRELRDPVWIVSGRWKPVFRRRHGDFQAVHLPHVDVCDLAWAASAKQAGDHLDRPCCRRQSDTLKRAIAFGFKPFERQRQQGPAFAFRERMDLIDNDGACIESVRPALLRNKALRLSGVVRSRWDAASC